MKTKLFLAGLLLLLAVAGALWYPGESVKLTDKDTLLIGDFANSTGEAAFDGALREALSIREAHSESAGQRRPADGARRRPPRGLVAATGNGRSLVSGLGRQH